MNQSPGDLCLEDVYDIAANIGKEFEVIIDSCGADAVRELMPKVIVTLEHLEAICLRKDEGQNEMDSLRSVVLQLECDKMERTERRLKYEFDLEQIEENWDMEKRNMAQMVSKLREQNIKLTKSLTEKDDALMHLLSEKAEVNEESSQTTSKFEESVSKLKMKVESLKKELESADGSNKKLREQLDTAVKLQIELNMRLKQSQDVVQSLTEEKSGLELLVDSNIKEICDLKQQLGDAAMSNVVLRIREKENRSPSFSLTELRDVFIERNDLRSRLHQLETQIGHHLKSSASCPDTRQLSSSPSSPEKVKEPRQVADIDLPVQGPINKEPDEKLFPRRKANILRFFPSLSWNKIKLS